MPMAAGTVASPTDRATTTPPAAMLGPAMMPMMSSSPATAMTVMPDAFAKEAMLAWFRGEFAAANAIIDALCGHLAQLSGGGSDYEAVFAAVHRRRLNWIPVLQMQKYHSIADVAMELHHVAAKKAEEVVECEAEDRCCNRKSVNNCTGGEKKITSEVVVVNSSLDGEKVDEKVVESNGNGFAHHDDDDFDQVVAHEEDDSPNSEITDTGKYHFHPNKPTLCSLSIFFN